jgi:hypothetical protein
MPTPQPTDRAAIGRARLAERARRVARIRRTVIAATLSAFVLAWGVIVFDGSMGSATFANSSSTTASPSATATPDTSSDDLSSSSSDSSPAPLTTSQS